MDAANDEFYAAFASLDVARMRAIWADRREDCCVHPGWEPLYGAAVQEAWRQIFAGASYMQFQISDVQIEVFGEIARVTCAEGLYSVGPGRTLHSRIVATNLFLRTPTGWRITYHHGSPVSVRYEDAPAEAN